MGRFGNVLPLAEELAAQVNGVAKVRDQAKMHVVGQLGGRDVRAILEDEGDKVGHVVQARTQRPAEVSFNLHHDSNGARLYALTRKHWDEWDEEDGSSGEKIFVTENLYYSGDRETLGLMQNFWGRFPRELQQQIIAHQEQSRGRFTFAARRVTLDPWDDVPVELAPTQIMNLLQLIVQVADAIDGAAGPYR